MPHPTQKSFEVIESHSLIITVITRCRVSDVQNWNHNTVVHFVFYVLVPILRDRGGDVLHVRYGAAQHACGLCRVGSPAIRIQSMCVRRCYDGCCL